MEKYRILVVHGSAVARNMISRLLEGDPRLEVVGTASSVELAIRKVEELLPDLVTLDVEMPAMSSLDAVRELHARHPKMPVVMFSPHTEQGAEATFEALSNGASDYVTMPTKALRVDDPMDSVRDQLIEKVRALCEARRSAGERREIERPFVSAPRSRPRQIEIVAIGSSAGGPGALTRVLKDLPAGFPVPIVIVQHMSPAFTRLLAERLDSECALHVVEARPGDLLEGGKIWLAPGDFHMVVERNGDEKRIQLNQRKPENSCRPAVDPLFRSVGTIYRDGVLAVVLTGMGQDGLRGCEVIRQNGGSIVVQDEASSTVWGMPGYVARAGLADAVLSIEAVAPQIVQATMIGTTGGADATSASSSAISAERTALDAR